MCYDIFILGCLMDGPHHGYNIKKLLSERFSACTTINNNTLYSLLRRYEQ
ncbi:helix-turn-helix transcriptional regulator [Desulfosporosinus sp. PR]|nr:helix-turn-helix transcriptional regulator [Desulfosporosinus sp. PR]